MFQKRKNFEFFEMYYKLYLCFCFLIKKKDNKYRIINVVITINRVTI